MLIKTTHDDVLKTAVRAGSVPIDIIGMETPLGEQVAAFKKALQQEALPKEAPAEGKEAQVLAAAEEGADVDLSQGLQAFLDGMQARVGEQVKSAKTMETALTFEEKARNLFHSNVELLVVPNSETELVDGLLSCKAAQVRGQDDKWVGIIADPGQWGEAITNPNVRPPPFREQYLKTFLNSVVKTRDPTLLTLHSRDLFCFLDNFTHNHSGTMTKSLCNSAGQALTKNIFHVNICYDEDSLRARRQYVKSQTTTFDQIEYMNLLTADPFSEQMKHRARSYYPGSSLGNKLGDIKAEPPQGLWSMTMKDFSRSVLF